MNFTQPPLYEPRPIPHHRRRSLTWLGLLACAVASATVLALIYWRAVS